MHVQRLFALLLLSFICSSQQQSTISCQAAIDAHTFAMAQYLALLSNSSSDNPDPTFLTKLRAAQISATLAFTPTEALLKLFPATSAFASWGNLAVQLTLSRSMHAPAAAIGEVAYIANRILKNEAALPAKAEHLDYVKAWQDGWLFMASQLQDNLLEVTDEQALRVRLFRIVNYLGMAAFANPASPQYRELTNNATDLFHEAMQYYPAYKLVRLDIPYTNGTVNGTLDAFFVSPSPSEKLPVVVVFSQPFHWKELSFVQYGIGALRRNYAVLFFDIPGQAAALHSPPYLRTDPNATNVFNSVLDYVQQDSSVAKMIDFDRVIVMGFGTGGYSTGVACAGAPSRVAACVLNPAWLNPSEILFTSLAQKAYGAFTLVAEDAQTTFPEQKYVQYMLDPVKYIVKPLVVDCDENSGAPELLAKAFTAAKMLDPELVLTSMSVLGLPGDTVTPEEAASQIWAAYRQVASTLVQGDVSKVQAPVIIFAAQEDVSSWTTRQGQRYFDGLSTSVRAKSKYVILTPKSGGSQRAAVGATPLFEEVVYPALTQIFGEGVDSAAGRR